MASDPLRHLRYQMTPITLRPGVSGWAVSEGAHEPAFWLVCDDRGEDVAWSWVHDIATLDGDELTMAEVIDQLGPTLGAEAVAMCAERLATLRRREADAAAIARLAADLQRGEVGLSLRIRATREAHLRRAHEVMRQLQAVGAPREPHDDGSPPFAYVVQAVVRESPGRWKVFRDEDDEDPLLMRLWTQPEPGDLPGWKSSYASLEGKSHRWRPLTVAQACRQVGPLHAGDVLATSAQVAAGMRADVAPVFAPQVEAARGDVGAWVAHVLRCHIACAQELARMEQHLATPGVRPA